MAEEDTVTQKISDNQVVHVRQSSQQDMDELFKRSLAKQDKKSGWHEKNLPPSFFREPHSREASIDESSYIGGAWKQPQPAQAQHVRGNSCPATMHDAALSVTRMPSSHRRTSSLEGILDERSLESLSLPPGWEQACTADGKPYFINHNNRTTSWNDPRKAILSQMSAEVQAPPVAAVPPGDGYGPLPEGWEKATTAQGETYFIDHINKVTSWFDPRLSSSMQRPGSRSGNQQQPAASPQIASMGGMVSPVSPQHVFPMVSHQQSQQPQQISPNPSAVAVSPTALPQLGHQRMPSAEYQRQLQLQRLHVEKEKLRRKEEEIRRQEALIRQSHMGSAGAVDQVLEPYGHDLPPAGVVPSGAGSVDPFLGGMVGGVAGGAAAPNLAYHVRQESGDSGLGGMRIAEEYAAAGGTVMMDEAMDSQESAAAAGAAVAPAVHSKRPVPATALAPARGNGDFLSSMDFNENHEADDLMSTLPEDIGGLEHLDVKMDLTWL